MYVIAKSDGDSDVHYLQTINRAEMVWKWIDNYADATSFDDANLISVHVQRATVNAIHIIQDNRFYFVVDELVRL